MTMKANALTRNHIAHPSGLALLAGLTAAIFLSTPSHAASISVVNGDFSTAPEFYVYSVNGAQLNDFEIGDVGTAPTTLKDADFNASSPAAPVHSWVSGGRLNTEWVISGGAAKTATDFNRAFPLFQVINVTGSTASASNWTFQFDVSINTDSTGVELDGIVEILTWNSAVANPVIAAQNSNSMADLLTNMGLDGSGNAVTFALSGAGEGNDDKANAGVEFTQNTGSPTATLDFVTGNGLTSGNTSGTFSKDFTLAAGHDRVAIIFQTEVGGATEGDITIDNVAIVPEPGTLALAGLGGLMMLRRRRSWCFERPTHVDKH